MYDKIRFYYYYYLKKIIVSHWSLLDLFLKIWIDFTDTSYSYSSTWSSQLKICEVKMRWKFISFSNSNCGTQVKVADDSLVGFLNTIFWSSNRNIKKIVISVFRNPKAQEVKLWLLLKTIGTIFPNTIQRYHYFKS